jgi:hypothetical protein
LEQFACRNGQLIIFLKRAFFQARAFAASLSEQLAVCDAKQLDGDRSVDSDTKVAKKRRIDARIQLWRRSHRRATFSGVKVDLANGSVRVAASPEESAEMLRAHWAPVFASKTTHDDAQESLLRFVPPIDGAAAKLPTLDDLETFLNKRPDSALGPDGLRNSAWKAAADKVLNPLMQCLRRCSMAHRFRRILVTRPLSCSRRLWTTPC